MLCAVTAGSLECGPVSMPRKRKDDDTISAIGFISPRTGLWPVLVKRWFYFRASAPLALANGMNGSGQTFIGEIIES